jgi:hypothetical protein
MPEPDTSQKAKAPALNTKEESGLSCGYFVVREVQKIIAPREVALSKMLLKTDLNE